MHGLAWATVGEMEPQLEQLQQHITVKLPAKLAKLESVLGPAQENVAALEKRYEEQVEHSCTEVMHISGPYHLSSYLLRPTSSGPQCRALP